jgi:carbonic anhydrase
VARKNVELTLANVKRDSPVLAELAANGSIKMIGAMYNIGTGAVEFLS